MPLHRRTTSLRRTRLVGRVGAVTAAAFTAVVLGAAPASYAARSADDPSTPTPPPAASPRSPDVVPLHVSADDARRALDHWTSERMVAAALAGEAAPGITRDAAASPDRLSAADARIAATAATAAAATPAAISRAEQVAPVPHIGRVFYTLDGHGFTCSANVVVSGNRSTVATAAHCMTAEGTYSTDAVFVPGYEHGQAPYGRWPVVGGVVDGGYAKNNDDLADDTGFLVVARDDSGQDITSVVGASPVLFDQPLAMQGTVYGYPGALRFDAQTLQRCRGRFRGDSPEVISLACDMNEGASGGPVFAGDGADGAQYANDDARYEDHSRILGPIWQANEHAAYTMAAEIAPAATAVAAG